MAAFAAAAISGGDPIKTGFQGFAYDIRTALLPFLFIFNTELLLIDVGLAKAVFVFIVGDYSDDAVCLRRRRAGSSPEAVYGSRWRCC